MVVLCTEAYTDVAMELAISETNYTSWFRNLALKKEGKSEPPVNILQLRLRVSFTFYLQCSVHVP